MPKIFCFLCLTLVCAAGDWSTLYPSTRLNAEQPRLQTAVDFLIQKEIQPFMPPQEVLAFGLQAVDLPLEGFRSDPLDFYADGHHIILPVRTLLFLEDLSRCYAWLWTGRYSTRTIDEYLGMLRYRSATDFPDGHYPAPLSALHIPEDALSNPKVVEAAVRMRRTAYAFILLHQFAHLQLRHDLSRNHVFSETQEEEADRFALNIMKENSTTPTGVFLVMYTSMLLETGTSESIHPVTERRLEAMAHFLDGQVTEFVRGRPDRTTAIDSIHSIASLLLKGSEWLSIDTHRNELAQLAMKTDPGTLLPRPLPKTTQ